jgi:hypothetical protein
LAFGDSTTHVGTWDSLVATLDTAAFTYVADGTLATRDNLEHIAGHESHFLTILSRTRTEDELGRDWIASLAAQWSEIARRPGLRNGNPSDVYSATEAPACSTDGFRIVWIRSSHKRVRDAAVSADRIERARADLAELSSTLSSARCRLKSRSAVEAQAKAALKETGATRFVRVSVHDTVTHEHRQTRRGGRARTPPIDASRDTNLRSASRQTLRWSPTTPPARAAPVHH